MSPVVEYALLATVAAYGLFGIYLSSLHPFLSATTSSISSIPEPVPLDHGFWTRYDNKVYGYAFAAPPGWIIDDRDLADLRVGRSAKELAAAGVEGEGLRIAMVPLYEGKAVEDAAAADFAGRRPALYDAVVDGREALFAIDFERGRVIRQAVYVPLGDAALTLSAARMDPPSFAAFVASVRFLASEELTPTP